MDKIVILDFGSQTTQLIGRRIREFGVYTEIVPGDAPLTCTVLDGAKGIILSGSPSSVYDEGAPVPDPAVYTTGLPLLGICYGLQRMTADHGGRVEPLAEREYGGVKVTLNMAAVKAAASAAAARSHRCAFRYRKGRCLSRGLPWRRSGQHCRRHPRCCRGRRRR